MLYRDIGAVSLPLDTSLITTNLRVLADPAVDILGSNLQSLINENLQAAWTAIGNTGTPCSEFIPLNPAPYLPIESTLTFPFLAIWREKSKIVNRSLDITERECNWKLQYVLGETSLQEQIRYGSVLNVVQGIVETFLTEFIPVDGYSVIESLGFSGLTIDSFEIGVWLFESEKGFIRYPALNCSFTTGEENSPASTNPAINPLEKITMDIDAHSNSDTDGVEIGIETDYV